MGGPGRDPQTPPVPAELGQERGCSVWGWGLLCCVSPPPCPSVPCPSVSSFLCSQKSGGGSDTSCTVTPAPQLVPNLCSGGSAAPSSPPPSMSPPPHLDTAIFCPAAPRWASGTASAWAPPAAGGDSTWGPPCSAPPAPRTPPRPRAPARCTRAGASTTARVSEPPSGSSRGPQPRVSPGSGSGGAPLFGGGP